MLRNMVPAVRPERTSAPVTRAQTQRTAAYGTALVATRSNFSTFCPAQSLTRLQGVRMHPVLPAPATRQITTC